MARLFDDASTEYLSVDVASVTAVPFTMSAWFYTDSTSLQQSLLQLVDLSTNDHWYNINLTGGKVRALAISTISNGITDTSTSYGANAWHHAAGVFPSTSSRSAYLDGGGKTTNTNLVVPAGIDRTAIGAFRDSTPGGYFSGRIAEVALWDVALSDDQVAGLSAGICPLMVEPQNLVNYWPLGGMYTADDADKDRMTAGNHLTPVNTPSTADHPPIIYPGIPIVTLPQPAAPVGGQPAAKRMRGVPGGLGAHGFRPGRGWSA